MLDSQISRHNSQTLLLSIYSSRYVNFHVVWVVKGVITEIGEMIEEVKSTQQSNANRDLLGLAMGHSKNSMVVVDNQVKEMRY